MEYQNSSPSGTLNGNKTFVIFVKFRLIRFDINTIKLTLCEIFARMPQKIVK